MALRLVEVLIPRVRADALRGLLGELDLQPLTEETLEDDRLRVRLVLEADRSGALVDRMQLQFGTSEQFALTILPVEAALPRREPPADVKERVVAPSIGSKGISREELYSDIDELSRTTGVFIATVVLSTVVAAVGILRDNTAVIIGAMVIAPLLGPNVALAFGTTLGDVRMIRRSLLSNAIGVTIALVIAVVLGLSLQIDPTVAAIADRTSVHLSDIALALASGIAGTLALTTGIPTALVGVMVAVALLPPTVVLGLMVGEAQWEAGAGAALLLLANVICVNLAGVVTFFVQGVRPLSWWEAAKARRSARIAVGIWITLLAALIAVIVLAGGGAFLS